MTYRLKQLIAIIQSMSNFNLDVKEELEDTQGYIPSEFDSLFPIRNPADVQLDLNTYRHLLDKLKCKFCSQLMQAPVYLKCSHRFCRPCIQRFIRSSSKKSCPSCRFPLLSKRELRSDDFTIDFIDLVFGPVKITTVSDAQEYEKLKLEESDQVKVRKRRRSRYGQIEHQQITNPRKKHRKMMNFEQNTVELRDSTPTNSSLEDMNYHMKVKLSSENWRQAKIEQRDIDNSDATEQQSESFQKYLVKQGNLSENTNDLGIEYFNKLRLKHGKQIFMKIKLQPNPFKPFTPSLNLSEIECSAFSKLETIIFLIYQELNLVSEYVVLYVMKQGALEIIDPDLTLATINEQFWINCSQYSPFDLVKNIDKLTLNEQQDQDEPQSSRLIYFSVEFDQQNFKKQ